MEKSQVTYKVESAAHVNLANGGADGSEISYAGGNWGCCDITGQWSFLTEHLR
jgi:hypothetical protein